MLGNRRSSVAGDWIKLECTTPDKPEIVRMASSLRIDQDAVVGKLLRVWVWADQNSIAGESVTITAAFIDRLTNRRGFARAMRDAGWLIGDDGAMTFPNFDRHNGTTAKARSVTNRRVAKHRTCNGDGVTKAEQKPLPEKRREEIDEKKDPAGGEPAAPVKAREPSGEHQVFIADWMAYYLKRNGSAYPFSGGRDGRAASQLLAHFKNGEAAKRFITAVHTRAGDGYPFANAETLYDLANNIGKLQAALAQKKGGKAPAPNHTPGDDLL
jgi:hypothetical protein